MKKTVLFLILYVHCFSVNLFAQNKLYLAKKNDPVVYKKPIGGEFKTNYYSTVSKSGKFLAMHISAIKNNRDSITANFMSVLIEMRSGKLLANKKNIALYFDRDNLIKQQFENFWNNPIPLTEFSNIMANTNNYTIVDPLTLSPISAIKIPIGEIYMGVEKGYYKTMTVKPIDGAYISRLYTYDGKELSKIGSFPIMNPTISQDGTMVTGSYLKDSKFYIVVYDISSGNILNKIQTEGASIKAFVDINNKLSYVSMSGLKFKLNITDLSPNQAIDGFSTDGGASFAVNDNGTLLTLVNERGEVKFIDLTSYKVIATDEAYHIDTQDLRGRYSYIINIGNGDFMIVSNNSGISKLISSKEKKVIADIYVDERDWAVIAADGRVDGTAGAFKKLEWRAYENDKVIARKPVDMLFDKYFTPGLLPQLLSQKVGDNIELIASLSEAPSVSITSPTDGESVTDNQITITVEAQEHGDPVTDIQIFINGKLFGGTQRGFKRLPNSLSQSFTIPLLVGKNVISAKAISAKKLESAEDIVTVYYKGQEAIANLHILAIAINKYLNTKYNLNYALADAQSIVLKLKQGATPIFKSIFVHELYDQNASKENIKAKLNEIARASNPEDVFLIYYAGHGVMAENNKDFYLALYDVTQLYGKDAMLKEKGLSADELKQLVISIKAQKQIIILDACQSGGAVNSFAARGAAEEKAIIQLARSSGTVLLASSGSEQFATEFAELGHGVFTYALLDGLSGQADGSSMDKKITVKELEAYINDKIPALTHKYHGELQFPRSWSVGQDFPIVIVK